MINVDCFRLSLLGSLLAVQMILLPGCGTKQQPEAKSFTKVTPITLRLLVIDDPALAKMIKREWEARSEGELDLQEMRADDLRKIQDRRINADAILYPSTMLGDLASHQWLTPFPKDKLDDPSYQFRDIFAATRKQEIIWEEETYAVPLGSAPLLLFYREDIFQDLSLKPPQTWTEYQEVSQKLATRADVQKFLAEGDSEWCGSIEPLFDVWAAQTLLARAASYSKHRSQFSTLFDYRTMEPLIAGPPFVRALQELVEVAKAAPKTFAECRPADSVRRLRLGQCAMAIGGLAEEMETSNPNNSSPAGTPPAIGVSPLPGSNDVYNFRSKDWSQRSEEENLHVPLVGTGGRLGSVTQESRQPAEAIRLLMWLSGPEMSPQISAASTVAAPFRQSHVPQVDRWTTTWKAGGWLSQDTIKQYGDAIQESLNETNCLVTLRIPGREQYLQALADSVRQTIDGKHSPDAALADVARKWQEITESLGVEKQRLAYAQSIGLKP